jgi:predicted  nucleic acid-binding Zn-ribbon protein
LNDIDFEITDLYRLQLAENRVRFYQREIEKLKNDEEVKATREELTEAEKVLEELLKKYHDLESERKKLEDDISLKSDKIKKDEQKLSSGTITSSKEIVSINEEIESLRKVNSELENNMLEIMISIDDLNEEINIQKEKKEKIEAHLKKQTDEIDEKIKAEEEILNKYKAKKEEVSKKIPSPHIEKFNEVAEKRGGVALGVLKERLCLSCNMEMSMVEAMNMSNDDLIYRCPNCRRMLIRYRPKIDEINEEYNE